MFSLCLEVSGRVGGNAKNKNKTKKQNLAKICYFLSSLHPGNQLYHSLLCIVLQFLILRLMGRTITAVLTTFFFQMVTALPSAAQVVADSSWE